MSEKEKKHNGGMIFYPREYVITDDHLTTYAYGVDQNGTGYVAFIHPTQSSIQSASENKNKSFPQFSEFSETSKRAKNPCFADFTNSPSAPLGMMMLEQVEVLGIAPQGFEFLSNSRYANLPVCVALWASNLREADDVPRAPIGIGFLETSFSRSANEELTALKYEYDQLKEKRDTGIVSELQFQAEEARMATQSNLVRKKRFTAVMLRPQEMCQITHFDQFLPVALSVFQKYTRSGMYGSVIVRTRIGDHVLDSICATCHAKYDYSKNEIEDFKKTIDDFMRFTGRKLLSSAFKQGAIVELIPNIRVNTGPVGNETIANDFNNPIPKVFKTYVDKDLHGKVDVDPVARKAFLASNIAIRLYKIPDRKKGGGNLLLSAIHSYSPPLGSYLCIDASGGFPYKLASKSSATGQNGKNTSGVVNPQSIPSTNQGNYYDKNQSNQGHVNQHQGYHEGQQ